MTQILSFSVKRLIIHNCTFLWDAQARISVPAVNFLDLVVDGSLIPFLDNTPQLVSASIRHEEIHRDCCQSRFEIGGCIDVSCQGCTYNEGEHKKSLLLESLSHAMHLELLACEVKMFIFGRDLTFCPVFNKLDFGSR